MNEQARRLQMCVAGEIEVVDLCAFEDGCLLRSDVRREKQEPISCGARSGPPTAGNLRAINEFAGLPADSSLTGRRAKVGGEAGIRTLGTGLSPYNGLANRRFRPLGHLTADAKCN